jgi:hypothetical protein
MINCCFVCLLLLFILPLLLLLVLLDEDVPVHRGEEESSRSSMSASLGRPNKPSCLRECAVLDVMTWHHSCYTRFVLGAVSQFAPLIMRRNEQN